MGDLETGARNAKKRWPTALWIVRHGESSGNAADLRPRRNVGDALDGEATAGHHGGRRIESVPERAPPDSYVPIRRRTRQPLQVVF